MKNMSILFLAICSISFFACSNTNPNQTSTKIEADTGVLIASNHPNLNVSPSEVATEMELESKVAPQTSPQDLDSIMKTKQKEKVKEGKTNQPVSKENQLQKEAITEIENKLDTTKEIDNSEVSEPDDTKNEVQKTIPKEEKITIEFNHDQWNQLLQKHVNNSGIVNYKGFKTEINKLNTYLKNLENNPVQSNWSNAKKMAYWINAYNAFTIKLILDNYPVSSITKLHGGKPWDVKWINIGNKTYSLNNIENDILRPQFKDARIHFAVNCAAKSCPPLANQAWTESNLNQLFEKQTKAFINNSKFNSISSNSIEISKIFEWYAVDFENLIDFLNTYSTTQINKNATIKYKDYNWELNQ